MPTGICGREEAARSTIPLADAITVRFAMNDSTSKHRFLPCPVGYRSTRIPFPTFGERRMKRPAVTASQGLKRCTKTYSGKSRLCGRNGCFGVASGPRGNPCCAVSALPISFFRPPLRRGVFRDCDQVSSSDLAWCLPFVLLFQTRPATSGELTRWSRGLIVFL